MDFTSTYKQQEYDKLKQTLTDLSLGEDVNVLTDLFENGWEKIESHGDFSRWSKGLSQLPSVDEADVCFSGKVEISSDLMPVAAKESVKDALKLMHPWRKGPFDLFGVHINTEWRSDWKWERVLPHISPLKDKVVLDIGCGSGYHLWRMMGEGAKVGIGIDPTPLFSFHFASVKRYQPQAPSFLIPTGIDEMPDAMACFDTVFSMGILYHRREPLEHLYKIKSLLKEGGELVLETLVVDGDETTCLMPTGRYAKMRNVWFIPSVAMLEIWLKRVGFKDVRCVDVNRTSIEEQRATEWMTFESLDDFLDPTDKHKTIEGYQAPTRAVMVAKR
ncbi:MAG: tRNA 5-methoxyuridine(34)/uridine 5-oxyacetic acid(34) synthase CmoB [Ghiorsea sp.]